MKAFNRFFAIKSGMKSEKSPVAKPSYFACGGHEILDDKGKSNWSLGFLFNECCANKFSLSGHLTCTCNWKKVDYWKNKNKETWNTLEKFFLKETIDSKLYGYEQNQGSVFKHRLYKLNKESLELLKKDTLTKWDIVNLLPDDLCFYKDNELLARITGHERMIELYLPKKQLEKFKKMEKELYTFPTFADKEFREAMDAFHKKFKNKQTKNCQTKGLRRKKDQIKCEMLYEFPGEKYRAVITFKKGPKENVAEREIEIHKNGQQIAKAKRIKKKEQLLEAINRC